MKKFGEVLSKVAKPAVLLIIIILLESVYTVYFFVNVKNGYHADEIWSFGLSNSYYYPCIYQESDQYTNIYDSDNVANFDEWISGEYYNDYLTVQEGEQFSYGSVYYNQAMDVHPPFYYLIVHTICSFNPSSFSYVYLLAINIVCLALTQVFLYKLSKQLLKSKYAALIPCLLYGAGTGALSTFVFLRMYSLVTALLTMYTYYNAKLFASEDYNLKKYVPPIFITSFLAFYTLYESIIYIGAITLCFCVYFLVKKRFKKMFAYGGFQLASLLLSFAVFPAFFNQLFVRNSVYGDKYYENFWLWFRKMLNYITAYNFGFHISVYGSSPAVFIVVFLSICVIGIPLCFLFRRELWFIRLKDKIKCTSRSCILRFVKWLRHAKYIPLFVVISTLILVLSLFFTADLARMNTMRIRYVAIIFPVVCASAFSLIHTILGLIPKIKGYKSQLALVTAILMVVKVNISYPTPFIFNNSEGFDYLNTTLFDNQNCLVVSSSIDRGAACYTNLTVYAKNTKNTFVTTAENLESELNEITAVDGGLDCVLISVDNYTITSTEQEEQLTEIGYDGYITASEESNDEEEGIFGGDESVDCTDVVNSLLETGTWDIKAIVDLNNRLYYYLDIPN